MRIWIWTAVAVVMVYSVLAAKAPAQSLFAPANANLAVRQVAADESNHITRDDAEDDKIDLNLPFADEDALEVIPPLPAPPVYMPKPGKSATPEMAIAAPLQPKANIQAQPGFANVLPMLSVESTGLPDIIVGRPATYKIAVNNLGDAMARGVTLDVILPPGVKDVLASPQATPVADGRIRFNIGDMATKEKRDIAIKLTPTSRGRMELQTQVSLTAASAIAANVRQANLKVTAAAPQSATYGQRMMFKVVVRNTGDVGVEDISLAQLLPQDVELIQESRDADKIGYLGPGEEQEVFMWSIPKTTGEVKMQFTAAAPHGVKGETFAKIHIQRPMVEIRTEGPEVAFLQRDGVYAVFLTNPGDAPANNVEVKVAMPTGFQVTAMDRLGSFDRNNSMLTFHIEELEEGGHTTLQYKGVAVAEGDHVHLVTVTGEAGLNAASRHVTQVIARADIGVQFVNAPGPVKVGDAGKFRVLVQNRGSKTASNIVVNVELPQGVAAKQSAVYSTSNGRILFPALSIPAGQKQELTFDTIGSTPGDHIVRVLVKAEFLPRPILAEETVFYYQSRNANRTAKRE